VTAGAPELPCADLVEVVTDVFEARLGPVDQERFDAHLAQCPDCMEYVAQVRRTVEALRRLRVDELTLHPRV
jgi:anti-sigma factor RsiW